MKNETEQVDAGRLERQPLPFVNSGPDPVAFRDDAPGKHVIEPGESFDVVGAQHLPHVLSLPGVRASAEPKAKEPRKAPVHE